MAEILAGLGLAGLGMYLNSDQDTDLKGINPNIYNPKIIDKSKQIENTLATRQFNNPTVTRLRHNQEMCESRDVIISKLSGKALTKEHFKHNNMQPYFGGSLKQNINPNSNISILDTFNGAKVAPKTEVKRMFNPSNNMGNTFGSPSINDRDYKRYTTSTNRAHEHPVEPVKVGPGLNVKYGKLGVGGFQQLDLQELIKPRSVDELRTSNNPKLTFKGRIISGQKGRKRANTIPLQKHRPDTYYKNNPGRYFKTGGAVKKDKSREKCYAKPTKKQNNRSYTGAPGPAVNTKPKKVGLYKKSSKNVYKTDGIRNLVGSDKGKGNDNDYSKKSFKCGCNERDVTQKRTHLSNFVTSVKALIAPVEDVFKTTRKENFVGNNRPSGNISMPIPEKLRVYDPNDVARTTIKETNIHNEHEGHLSGPSKITVHDPNDVARTTLKETNIDNNHDGHLSGPSRSTVYDPTDVARTTIKETNIHNEHDGNLSGPSRITVHDPNDIARTTIKELDIDNNHNGSLNGPIKLSVYDPSDVAKTTIKETNIHNEYDGHLRGLSRSTVYDPNDVARTTIKETNIHNDREGNLSGPSRTKAYDPNDVARTTIKETNIHNDREGNLSGPSKTTTYDPNDVARTTIKETNIHNEYDGHLSGPSRSTAYDPNDVARTTIKETNIDNNHDGYLNGPNRITVYDPNDIAKTTIKETNIHNDHDGNLQGPKRLTVYDPNDVARTTIKETNIHDNRLGVSNSSVEKHTIYSSETKPKITIRNTLANQDTSLNLDPQSPERGIVYDPNNIAKTTIKETSLFGSSGNVERQSDDGYLVASTDVPNTNKQFTSDYEYTGNADGDVRKGGGEGYLVAPTDISNTNKQFLSDYEYSGIANSANEKPTSYSNAYNASLNINKEEISVGREPTKSNVKISTGEDAINMEFRKLENDIINSRDMIQDKIYSKFSEKDECQITNQKINLPNDMNEERIDPKILDTFRQNPFTQSLKSA